MKGYRMSKLRGCLVCFLELETKLSEIENIMKNLHMLSSIRNQNAVSFEIFWIIRLKELDKYIYLFIKPCMR